MPVNRKKMANLVKEYGKNKAKSIYYALETKAKKAASKKRVKK